MERKAEMKKLNVEGVLSEPILRLFEHDYKWNTKAQFENLLNLKEKAFLFRNMRDGRFDEKQSRVMQYPSHGNSNGPSCFVNSSELLELPFLLYAFPLASIQDLDEAEFAAEIRRHRGGPSNNRIVMSFQLSDGQTVSERSFNVTQRNSGLKGHVTIAVADANGLGAVEEDIYHFRIPEISNLAWELSPVVYVCAGHAEWREDVFPGNDNWRDVIKTLDFVMRHSHNFDDYIAIWRVHSMLNSANEKCEDLSVPLRLALDTIVSAFSSGAFDPNESDSVAENALNFLAGTLSEMLTN